MMRIIGSIVLGVIATIASVDKGRHGFAGPKPLRRAMSHPLAALPLTDGGTPGRVEHRQRALWGPPGRVCP